MLTQLLQSTDAAEQYILCIDLDFDIESSAALDIAIGIIDIDIGDTAAQVPESSPVLRVEGENDVRQPP